MRYLIWGTQDFLGLIFVILPFKDYFSLTNFFNMSKKFFKFLSDIPSPTFVDENIGNGHFRNLPPDPDPVSGWRGDRLHRPGVEPEPVEQDQRQGIPGPGVQRGVLLPHPGGKGSDGQKGKSNIAKIPGVGVNGTIKF